MAKAAGNSKTGQAAEYKNSKRWESNRRKKLERALKAHPNNKQIEEALKNIVYRRKTPKTPQWSKTKIRIAGLFKRFTGVVHMDMFNNNEKISVPATLKSGPYSKFKGETQPEKTMFQIAVRARYV